MHADCSLNLPHQIPNSYIASDSFKFASDKLPVDERMHIYDYKKFVLHFTKFCYLKLITELKTPLTSRRENSLHNKRETLRKIFLTKSYKTQLTSNCNLMKETHGHAMLYCGYTMHGILTNRFQKSFLKVNSNNKYSGE